MKKKTIAIIAVILLLVILIFPTRINNTINSMTSIDKSCETDLDCKISGTDCTLCGCSSTDAVNKNYKPTCIIPDLNRLFVMCSTCRSYLTKCENKQCVIIQ